jgi:hypothetical protein
MKRILDLFAVLITIGLIGSAAIASKPNVVFIFVDDQGYYDLGCYGATEVKTPRIDAWRHGAFASPITTRPPRFVVRPGPAW